MRRSPREFPLRYGGRTSDTTLMFRELTYATAQFARVVPSGTSSPRGSRPSPESTSGRTSELFDCSPNLNQCNV